MLRTGAYNHNLVPLPQSLSKWTKPHMATGQAGLGLKEEIRERGGSGGGGVQRKQEKGEGRVRQEVKERRERGEKEVESVDGSVMHLVTSAWLCQPSPLKPLPAVPRWSPQGGQIWQGSQVPSASCLRHHHGSRNPSRLLICWLPALIWRLSQGCLHIICCLINIHQVQATSGTAVQVPPGGFFSSAKC